MKLVAMHEAKAKLSEYVAVSQKDRVLITNHGKPAALVIGVEGESLEDLLTQSNPKFWEMIEEARKQPTMSLAEAKEHFAKAEAFEAEAGRPMSEDEARRAVSRKSARTRGAPRKTRSKP